MFPGPLRSLTTSITTASERTDPSERPRFVARKETDGELLLSNTSLISEPLGLKTSAKNATAPTAAPTTPTTSVRIAFDRVNQASYQLSFLGFFATAVS